MKQGNIAWGLTFILAALLIVCNQFGILKDVNIASTIAGLIFAVMLIKGIVYKRIDEVLFSGILLYVIFDTSLGLPDLEFWPGLLIAVLLSIGFHMLFPKHYINTEWKNRMHYGFEQRDGSNVVFGEDVSYENEKNEVNYSVSFGSSVKYINSSYFENADLRCSFGELKVYFDNVVPANGVCTVNLDVSFGDIQLYVPRTWRVRNNIRCSLAGTKVVGNAVSTEESNCINIEGNASFAGIEIYYI